MRGGANQPLVGSYNRNLVLEAIRSAGTASRVELVGVTGLTGPAVGGIVRRLIDDGLVAEAGQAVSTGGKPRTLLRVRPDAAYAVGVLIDVDATTYVLSDLTGTVVATRSGKGFGRVSPDTAIEQLAAAVGELVDGYDRARIAGIGVAAPGPLDRRSGVVHDPPNFRRWHEVALRDRLAAQTGLGVLVDNDATAAVVGERWVGGAAGVADMVCVYMGAGIGAGLVLDGQVRRGATSNAGELGHTSLDLAGEPCYCGNRGCLELSAAPRAVVDMAQRAGLLPARGRGVLVDYVRVCRAAEAGDRRAARLLERAAADLAGAVVNLVNLVDPSLVVLAGRGFATGGEVHRAAVERALRHEALARSSQDIEVRLSRLPVAAAAIGAASLVLDARFAPRMNGLVRPDTNRTALTY